MRRGRSVRCFRSARQTGIETPHLDPLDGNLLLLDEFATEKFDLHTLSRMAAFVINIAEPIVYKLAVVPRQPLNILLRSAICCASRRNSSARPVLFRLESRELSCQSTLWCGFWTSTMAGSTVWGSRRMHLANTICIKADWRAGRLSQQNSLK